MTDPVEVYGPTYGAPFDSDLFERGQVHPDWAEAEQRLRDLVEQAPGPGVAAGDTIVISGTHGMDGRFVVVDAPDPEGVDEPWRLSLRREGEA